MQDQTNPRDDTLGAPSGAEAVTAPDGAAVRATTAEHRSEERTKVLAVYALHLAAFITGFTSIVALILAYVFRGDADPVMRSHYDNAIGIFWKGILYGIACFLLTLTVIGAISWLALAVWWAVRCIKGLVKANEGQPYPNPGSWGF